MLGDVEMEGKLVTSQYFYNFTTNIDLSLLHLPVSSEGGKQRHAQAYGPSPTRSGEWKGENTQVQKTSSVHVGIWGLTSEVMGCRMWFCGLEVSTHVSLTQLRQWCSHTGKRQRPCTLSMVGGERSKVIHIPTAFLRLPFLKKVQGEKQYLGC